MNLIGRLFKREKEIRNYDDFWQWFVSNSDRFYGIVKDNKNINNSFFSVLEPKIRKLHDGIFYITGMSDSNTAELVLTADGFIKNIVFVEELVEASPIIRNWKITALKQPSDNNTYGIEISGFKFNNETLQFYAEVDDQYPDNVQLFITHDQLDGDNQSEITTGIFLAIDNVLGELNSITKIDSIDVLHPSEAKKDLIPIEKLRDYLNYREKEFIEKYDGIRSNTENDQYSGIEAELENGQPLVAFVNQKLINWDSKPSHPWILEVIISFEGTSNNGMPNKEVYGSLNEIEDEIMNHLKDSDGYLNVGRQTAEGKREIYWACKEFRKPSRILNQISNKYQNAMKLNYYIYRDKYWRSLSRFNIN